MLLYFLQFTNFGLKRKIDLEKVFYMAVLSVDLSVAPFNLLEFFVCLYLRTFRLFAFNLDNLISLEITKFYILSS